MCIYIYRERERHLSLSISLYVYIHIYIYIYIYTYFKATPCCDGPRPVMARVDRKNRDLEKAKSRTAKP